MRGEGLVVYDQLESEHSRGKFLVRQERKYNFELCRVEDSWTCFEAAVRGKGGEICVWRWLWQRILCLVSNEFSQPHNFKVSDCMFR